jgi:hypothetical protein
MIHRKTAIPALMLTGIAALTTTFAAYADNVPKDRTIVRVQTYSDWAAVQYDPPFANNVGCGGGAFADRAAVVTWGSNPDNKAMYAALIAAHVAGKPVGFGISNCYTGYGGGVPLIYRVDLEQ